MDRVLRMGMVGGGPGAFIGEVHRKAARLDGGIEVVAGALDIDPKKSKYDPKLGEVIKLLKGRKTILGLLVSGGKPSDSTGEELPESFHKPTSPPAGRSGELLTRQDKTHRSFRD